jgi:hypothetical protein
MNRSSIQPSDTGSGDLWGQNGHLHGHLMG